VRRRPDTGLTTEQLRRNALERLVTADLLEFDRPVIPIKTRARWYGALSRGAIARGATLPDLARGTARLAGGFIFVALWGDEGPYTPDLVSDCASAAFCVAAALGMERVAFPALGGSTASSSSGRPSAASPSTPTRSTGRSATSPITCSSPTRT
jgi:hypothetical protein